MKHEIKITEINRVEALLKSIDREVELYGRRAVILWLSERLRLFRLDELDEKSGFSKTIKEMYSDLKTQLNWVKCNEG